MIEPSIVYSKALEKQLEQPHTALTPSTTTIFNIQYLNHEQLHRSKKVQITRFVCRLQRPSHAAPPVPANALYEKNLILTKLYAGRFMIVNKYRVLRLTTPFCYNSFVCRIYLFALVIRGLQTERSTIDVSVPEQPCKVLIDDFHTIENINEGGFTINCPVFCLRLDLCQL